jgi:hypothetical protein
MRGQLAALLAALALALAGCGGTSKRMDQCAGAPTFATVVFPNVVMPKCLPCHSMTVMGTNRMGAPVGLDFDTYDLVKPNIEMFADAITSGLEPPMSSGITTTKADRSAVITWRMCNFPP